jgi:hypothetical protein
MQEQEVCFDSNYSYLQRSAYHMEKNSNVMLKIDGVKNSQHDMETLEGNCEVSRRLNQIAASTTAKTCELHVNYREVTCEFLHNTEYKMNKFPPIVTLSLNTTLIQSIHHSFILKDNRDSYKHHRHKRHSQRTQLHSHHIPTCDLTIMLSFISNTFTTSDTILGITDTDFQLK